MLFRQDGLRSPVKLSNKIACVAFFFWLFGSWMGAHGHFCFDGQEPPLSFHMDMIDDHPTHDANEQHHDIDVDIQQPGLAKLIKVDLTFALIAAFFLFVLWSCVHTFFPHYSVPFDLNTHRLRPPSQAPPVVPA
jgi:hypothetical protein